MSDSQKTKFLVSFFIFLSFFPLFRGLTIGHEESSTLFEVFISTLPDFFSIIFLLIYLNYFSYSIFNINKVDIVLIYFLIINSIWGIFWGWDLKLAIYGMRMTYLPIIFYFIGKSLSKENIIKITTHITSFYIYYIALSLILYLFTPLFYNSLFIKTGGVITYYFIPRFSSFFFSPIPTGTLLVLLGIQYSIKISSNYNIKQMFVYIIILTSLILTMSRGAIASFIISYFILSLIQKRFLSTIKLLLFLLPLAFLISLQMGLDLEAISWFIETSYQTITFDDNLTRVKFWKSGDFDILTQIVGNGIGKSGHIAHRFLLNSDIKGSVYSTDGWFFKLYNETGILGLGLFIFFLLITLNTFRKNWNLVRNDQFYLSVFAAFIAINIQNLVSNVYDFSYLIQFYWLILGAAMNSLLNKNNLN